MACPTCGGGFREPVAPGLWRCTSPVSHWEGTGAATGHLLGRAHDVPEVEGWVFLAGSSHIHRPRDAAPFFMTSAVDTDGNRWFGLSEFHGWRMREDPREPRHGDFTTKALAEMADLAELPPLPVIG